MDWKTSNHMDGSEIRDSIGLQYFAEDGNTSDTGADMDGFNGDDFLAALEGNDDLENQQTAAEGEEETVQDGAENQRAEEQQEEPENQPPEGGEVPPETVEQPVQTVPLVYNGQQIMLPADAVQALTGALGANPVELLQKGMNYDRKAEREMRVLDQYAEAAGMNRQQYLEQLEGARNEQLLSAEIEKCRTEFRKPRMRRLKQSPRAAWLPGGRPKHRLPNSSGRSLPLCSSALSRPSQRRGRRPMKRLGTNTRYSQAFTNRRTFRRV